MIAGLLTRLVGCAMCFEMTAAILKMHLKNGMIGQGGYELPLALGTLAFALIFFGPGPISLDAVLERGRGGKKSR